MPPPDHPPARPEAARRNGAAGVRPEEHLEFRSTPRRKKLPQSEGGFARCPVNNCPTEDRAGTIDSIFTVPPRRYRELQSGLFPRSRADFLIFRPVPIARGTAG